MVASDRPGDNGHNVKHRRFPLSTRKPLFTAKGDQALEQVAEIGCGISLLGDIQQLDTDQGPWTMSGHGPGQPASGDPEGVEPGNLPLQPQLFCDALLVNQ